MLKFKNKHQNYILDYLESSNVSVSNLKLQKLLYFSYGIYLQSYNTKLFENKIEAWMRGPVVEAVYKEFKKCIIKHVIRYTLCFRDENSGKRNSLLN